MKKSKINKIVIFTQPVGGARGGLIRNYFVHLPFELNDNMRETV